MIQALIGAKRMTGFAALLLIPVSLYMAFVYAPTDINQGVVQRIFYYHVATAWNGYVFLGMVALW